MHSESHLNDVFDVAIIGSGLAGTMLGSILARHGQKVLIIEKDSHPKFTIGESMLPQSAAYMRIIGDRYDIPEIMNLSAIKKITEHVGDTCGVKKCLGFLYHREGEPQRPLESHLLIQPEVAFVDEVHYFRQDIDMYLLQTSIKYGCTYWDRTTVTELVEQDAGWELRFEQREPVSARFVVDGSGFRSVLAHQFGLRDSPTRLRTNTRSTFSHMVGVGEYQKLFGAPELMKDRRQGWDDGTLHHMFDGGWFWVIPFGNHRESSNKLWSIGVTVDNDRHPAQDISPEREFKSFVDRFPGISAQLGGAEAIRPWIRVPRLQYSSTRSVGKRYFLLPHSYGFVDPLFSRGIISTSESINSLAWRLIEALEEDDFSEERFEYLERLNRLQLETTDRSVRNAYTCFSDFELWNAWIKVWLTGKVYGDLRLFSTYIRFLEDRDDEELRGLERDPLPGAECPHLPEHSELLTNISDVLCRYEVGELPASTASTQIHALLDGAAFLPPLMDWSDKHARHIELDPPLLLKILYWGGTDAPDDIKKRVFDFDARQLIPKPDAAPEFLFKGMVSLLFKGMGVGMKVKNRRRAARR